MVDNTERRDLNATCEDYHSDDGDDGVVLPTPTANVTAKRSPSSELGKSSGVDVSPSDMQSDSGYSSHTAATMASADSASSARSPPTAPTSAASIPPPSPASGPTRRRRETLVAQEKQQTSQSSPRKPLQRAPSTTSKRPSANRRLSTSVTNETGDCTDPNCTECGPNALAFRSRPDSALDVSYPQAYDLRSQHSEPTPSIAYPFPASPTFARQPPLYAQGSAVVQPAATRRRSSSTAGPRRPTYYNEAPGQAYYAQGATSAAYTPTPQEHGPPPTLARYSNMAHPQMQPPPAHPHMSPYMMQPGASYYPTGQPLTHQTPSPYEAQRPTLSARNSSNPNYQARRTQSGYGSAQVVQPDKSEPMPSARYSNVPKGPRREEFQDESESESSEPEYTSDEEVQLDRVRRPRELMPPPSKPKGRSKDGRPPMRKAVTTTVINDEGIRRRGSVSQSRPDRRRDSTVRTRAPSTSRPPLAQNPKAGSFPRQGKANVVVENSKTQRPRSYHQSYEADYDAPLRTRRSSKVYTNEYEERDVDRKRRSNTPKLYHDDRYDRELERKRSHRNSKVYQDMPQFDLAEPERPRRGLRDSVLYNEYDDDNMEPERSRRGADAPAVMRRDVYTDRKDRHKASEAEAYQQRTRGSNDPLNDLIHKAALTRQSRVPSDAASSRSDDRKSHASRAQTSMTSGGNGEIRLRVDASAPISLSLNGDMNGRTLQVVPGEDGMADIVIGGSQERETVYRNERRSVLGGHRKSITAPPDPRRDAEERSIRSSRSNPTRREAERPARGAGVLRRKTDFN